MIRILFLSVIVFFVQCICVHSASHNVTHTVVDGFTAQPIEGARVFHTWHRDGVAHHAETTTDADGVAVTEFPADAHEPRVGISASRYTPLSFSPTNTHYTHELIPTRTYTVRGVITTTEGEAIANTHVFLAPDDTAWTEAIRGCDAWSDDEGSFVINGVPLAAGASSVHSDASPYVSIHDERYRVMPGRGDTFVRMEMQKGTGIRGRVMRDDSDPAVGARVWARQLQPDEHGVLHHTLINAPFAPIPGCVAYTDEDGYYAIDSIPPHAYFTLHVDHPDLHATMHEPLSGRVAAEREITFTLPSARTWVQFTLTTPDDTPITNPVILVQRRFTSMTSSGESIRYWQTPIDYHVREDGTLLTAHIPPESGNSIRVQAPGHRELFVHTHLRPNMTNTITRRMEPPQQVVVTLFDAFEGVPVTNAIVTSPTTTNRPDAHGQITYALLSSKQIEVLAPGYEPYTSFLHTHAAEQFVYMPRPISFDVHVYTHEGEPAADGGMVEISFHIPDAMGGGGRGWLNPINAQGYASFTNMSALSSVAEIRTFDGHYSRNSSSLVVSNLVPEAHYSFVLTQTFSATAVVRVSRPEEEARPFSLNVHGRDGGPSMSMQMRPHSMDMSPEHFVYRIPGLSAGRYELGIQRAGYVTVRTNITVSLAHTLYEVDMPYPSEPAATLVIELPESYDELRRFPQVFSQYVTDSHGTRYRSYIGEGQIHVTELPAHSDVSYTLHLTLWGETYQRGPFTLEESPVSIELPPDAVVEGVAEFPDTHYKIIYVNDVPYPLLSDDAFQIPCVPYGTHTLRLYAMGFGMTNIALTVDSPVIDVGTITIPHTATATVRGQIHRLSPHVNVRYIKGLLPMDSDGNFVLTNLVVGKNLTIDTRDGRHFTTLTNITVQAGETDLGALWYSPPDND